jgi:hypothetical protein
MPQLSLTYGKATLTGDAVHIWTKILPESEILCTFQHGKRTAELTLKMTEGEDPLSIRILAYKDSEVYKKLNFLAIIQDNLAAKKAETIIHETFASNPLKVLQEAVTFAAEHGKIKGYNLHATRLAALLKPHEIPQTP